MPCGQSNAGAVAVWVAMAATGESASMVTIEAPVVCSAEVAAVVASSEQVAN